MNALDIIVIAVVALSALFAFARGFVKESLSIVAWVGAGLITLRGLPHLSPVAEKYITTNWNAAAAARTSVGFFLAFLTPHLPRLIPTV